MEIFLDKVNIKSHKRDYWPRIQIWTVWVL